ncbi:MAG: hypothetical protein AUJ96_17280 [Armatimonadetes bacterium CG2_30_66_41]|nr:MAG: hypothetical protein AUJ96_17280 [Armatimonadetes bacterium CG2_30_66_41]
MKALSQIACGRLCVVALLALCVVAEAARRAAQAHPMTELLAANLVLLAANTTSAVALWRLSRGRKCRLPTTFDLAIERQQLRDEFVSNELAEDRLTVLRRFFSCADDDPAHARMAVLAAPAHLRRCVPADRVLAVADGDLQNLSYIVLGSLPLVIQDVAANRAFRAEDLPPPLSRQPAQVEADRGKHPDPVGVPGNPASGSGDMSGSRRRVLLRLGYPAAMAAFVACALHAILGAHADSPLLTANAALVSSNVLVALGVWCLSGRLLSRAETPSLPVIDHEELRRGFAEAQLPADRAALLLRFLGWVEGVGSPPTRMVVMPTPACMRTHTSGDRVLAVADEDLECVSYISLESLPTVMQDVAESRAFSVEALGPWLPPAPEISDGSARTRSATAGE